MAKTKQEDPAEVIKQFKSLMEEAYSAVPPALEMFAEFQQIRARRLQEGLTEIKNRVGEEHSDFVAMRDALERAEQLGSHFKSEALRMENLRQPKDREWLVYGQVLDVRGEPAGGLHVRVFDRDRKHDDLLGETQTDSNGDFAIRYHEHDFAEIGGNLSDLYVMVSDQDGKILYSSREHVRFETGKSEYFLIQLGEPTRVQTKRTKPPSKQRKRNT